MRLVVMAALVLAVVAFGGIALRPRIARAAMLPVGALAPDFHSQVVTAEQVSPANLSDYRGHKLVLYFYPKDNTSGCTKEACAFRDGYALFSAWGIAVLGCSIDSADSHRAFARKYRLPFPLLLDPERKIARAYGAENGIPILGLDRRVTYVIDENGRILKVYPDVDPAAHARQILHDLGAENPPTPAPSPAVSAPAAASGATPAARKPVMRHPSREEEE